MGRLSRKVKYISKERRLSIPAEFLHMHSINRGAQVVLIILGERILGFALGDWENHVKTLETAEKLHLSSGLFQIFRSGLSLTLGSQDRLVIPKCAGFPLRVDTTLSWDLIDGVLVLEAGERSLELKGLKGLKGRTLQRHLRVARNPKVHEAVISGKLSVYKAEEIIRTGVDLEQAIDGNWSMKQIKKAGAEIPRRLARSKIT